MFTPPTTLAASTLETRIRLYLGNRTRQLRPSAIRRSWCITGDLYLFYNDAYGTTNYVYTSDGVNWSGVYSINTGYFIDASQSAVVYNGEIYVGLRDHASYSLILATVDSSNNTGSTIFPSIGLNFNPGLAVFNNELYIGITTDANSHDLYYFTTSDGVNLAGPFTGIAAHSSSTAPTLAVLNNVLYYGFRANDSTDVFWYLYSTDGVNWSSTIRGNVAIGGNPELVVAPDLPGPENGDIFFLWASDSSPDFYLCSMHAPVP